VKHGLDWYKREPRPFLDGIRSARLTAREVAVYTVVLDLIYEGSGRTPNAPKYVAGYLDDMGSAAVRVCIARLIELGKLDVDGDYLTNKRAQTEVKTRENRSISAAVSGRIGGISSGVSRRKAAETLENDEANASVSLEAKRREDIEKSPPLPPKGGAKGAKAPSVVKGRIDYPADFEAFFAAYPRRVGKGDAAAAFAHLDDDGRKAAIAAAPAFARKMLEVERRPQEKILYPASWLRARGWDDFISWEDDDATDRRRDRTAAGRPEEPRHPKPNGAEPRRPDLLAGLPADGRRLDPPERRTSDDPGRERPGGPGAARSVDPLPGGDRRHQPPVLPPDPRIADAPRRQLEPADGPDPMAEQLYGPPPGRFRVR
jgi:hypothetical protein